MYSHPPFFKAFLICLGEVGEGYDMPFCYGIALTSTVLLLTEIVVVVEYEKMKTLMTGFHREFFTEYLLDRAIHPSHNRMLVQKNLCNRMKKQNFQY